MKYKKKPLIIEAEQWHANGDHSEDHCEKFRDSNGELFEGEGHIVRYYRDPDDDGNRPCEYCSTIMHHHEWIDTLQGGHTVCPGDYIIEEPFNNIASYYPCKPDVFMKTYDPL